MNNIYSIINLQELQHFLEYVANSLSLEMIIKILISCLFIIWFAVAVWVIKDITTRSTSIIMQSFSLLLIIFFTPIFGLPLYLLIRPRATLFERHYEENWLENYDKQEEIHAVECLKCQEEISGDAKFCPYCGTKQFDTCGECSTKMLLTWKYCTSCGTHRREESQKESSKKEFQSIPLKEKKTKR